MDKPEWLPYISICENFFCQFEWAENEQAGPVNTPPGTPEHSHGFLGLFPFIFFLTPVRKLFEGYQGCSVVWHKKPEVPGNSQPPTPPSPHWGDPEPAMDRGRYKKAQFPCHQWGQTPQCNLHSRAPHAIRLRLGLHLKSHPCLVSSLPLPCFFHSQRNPTWVSCIQILFSGLESPAWGRHSP